VNKTTQHSLQCFLPFIKAVNVTGLIFFSILSLKQPIKAKKYYFFFRMVSKLVMIFKYDIWTLAFSRDTLYPGFFMPNVFVEPLSHFNAKTEMLCREGSECHLCFDIFLIVHFPLCVFYLHNKNDNIDWLYPQLLQTYKPCMQESNKKSLSITGGSVCRQR
jgi:hypothetical protein